MALGSALKSVFTRFTFGFDGAKLTAINRTTGQAVTNLSLAAKQAAALKTQVSGFVGGLKGFIALAVGGVAVRALTTGFSVGADQVAKFAKATGLATDTYQGLIHAGGLAGITQEEINKSLMQLSKRARDASMGLKASKLAFEEIGVSVTDASGKLKNGDQIMLELADRFKEMPDGSKKTALSMELMGRSGAKLNVLLNEGSKGIRRYILDAKKLGIVLSKEDLAAAERFNDQMLRMKSVFIGLRNQIATRIVPTFAAVAEAFVMLTRTGFGAKAMLTALIAVAAIATVIVGKIVTTFLIAQWAAFVRIIRTAVLVISQMNFAMLPVLVVALAIAAAIAGIAIAIEDIIFFMRGDKSLIGRLFGEGDKAALLGAIQELKDTLKGVVSDLSMSWKKLWASIVKLAGAFGIKLTTVGKLLKTIGKFLFKVVIVGLIAVGFLLAGIAWTLSKIFGWFADIASTVFDELLPVVERIRDAFSALLDWLQPVFDGIARAAKFTADKVGGFFTAAADAAKAAWRGVGKLIDTMGNKATNAIKRIRQIVGRQTQQVITPPAAGAAIGGSFAGPPPPRGGASGPQASLNVGSINIDGSGLGPAEMRDAIDQGLTRAWGNSMRNFVPSGELPA